METFVIMAMMLVLLNTIAETFCRIGKRRYEKFKA